MLFGKEIKIGKIFGIEINIDYSWFWIFLLITWSFASGFLPAIAPSRSVLTYIIFALLGSFLFFSSVLVHELSHSLVARKNNLPINKITLFIFGGVSNLEDEPPSAGVEIKMAAAGPLSSIVIGVILIAISFLFSNLGNGNIFLGLLALIGYINLSLAIFNLLPGFPLDGGRILRGIIWARNKDFLKSTRIASYSGKALAVIMIVFGVYQIFTISIFGGIWIILIGLFLFYAASASYPQALAVVKLRQRNVFDLKFRDFLVVKESEKISLLYEKFISSGESFFKVENERGEIIGLVLINNLSQAIEKEEVKRVKDVMISILDIPKVNINRPALSLLKAFNQSRIPIVAIIDKDKDDIKGFLTIEDLRIFLSTIK